LATSNKNFKVKNGLDVAGAATADSFVKLGGTSDEFLMADGSVSAGGGGGSLEVSETPPSSPSEGDIWYNSQTGQTFVYYDSFWVENIAGIAGPEGPTGPIGETGLVAQASEPGDTSTLWLDTDEDGVGIPLGGTAGQVLAKVDSVDFNTEWVDVYTPTEIDNLLDDKANSASPTFTVPGEQVTTATVDVYGTYAASEPSSLIFMVDQGSLLGAATVGTSVRFLQESAISQYTYTVDDKFISMPPIPNSIHVKVTSVNSTALSALIAWGDLQQQPPGNKEVSTIQESTTTISATEIGYLDGVTSSIQTQILAALVPSGTVSQTARATAPTGYLLCDGSAISRTTYSSLFDAIGTAYGVGDNSTTFNIPNLKGRVPVGFDSSQTEFDTLGETGGAKTHTLTEAQMPSHTHIQNSHNHTQDAHNHSQNPHNHSQTIGNIDDLNFTGGGGQNPPADGPNAFTNGSVTQSTTATNNATTATNQATTATNQNTGGGQAHNNLQPYVVLNYMIKI
jgi:microcystin-dependent protein